MKALLIAEKPSLKRTIEATYKKHQSEIPYELTCLDQRGHLLTLKMPDELDESLKEWSWDTLPIHPENYGGWKYKIISEQKQGNYLTPKEKYQAIAKELKSGQYDFVINAGDPDQEGELLIRIVLAAIGNTLPIKRFWTNATTDDKVFDALINLKDDIKDPMFCNLLSAAYARQHSDYRFGTNISRAASLKMNGNVSCGRVKTPILAVVCQRENEIKNFTPKTTYGVKVNYSEGFSGQMTESAESDYLSSKEKNEEEEQNSGIVWFETKDEALSVINSINTNTAKVIDYQSKKVESYAPKLYKLATAQIAAGKLGYTAQDTLNIIQGLYEKGYLSYPRTDCEYISSSENLGLLLKSAASVPALAPYINSIESSVIGKVKATKKWVNDKELEKSGHSALIPTSKAPDMNTLSPEERAIYELICRRFVAIFLPPLIQNKTLLISDIDGNYFRSTGKTLVSKGYTEMLGTNMTDNNIPYHKVGDNLNYDDLEVAEKTSVCPKRFTDASLIAMCETPLKYLEDQSLKSLGKELTIGTPATRAPIIEELIAKNKYLQRMVDKKTTYIVPTDIGMAIYENLKGCNICKIDMTGEWEIMLEKIRQGELSLPEMESFMKNDVEVMINDIKTKEMQPIATKRNMPVAVCPVCGGEIRSSAKSFYCSNWKDKGCKVGAYNRICDSTLKAEEFAKLISGRNILKTIKKGAASWKQELTYNFEENKIEFVKKENHSESGHNPMQTDYCCPNCAEKMNENPIVISCPSCDFKLWKSVGANHKELTDTQIKSFFDCGDTGLICGIKSKKTGQLFNAHITLNSECNGTVFVYEK